jgi:hypothetical protein
MMIFLVLAPLWRLHNPDAGDVGRGEPVCGRRDLPDGDGVRHGSWLLDQDARRRLCHPVRYATLGCYFTLVDSSLSSSAVRLTVAAGVLAIMLISLAIRRPFTLQYAREVVDAETAGLPGFLKANYIITWAWAAASLLIVMADVLMIYVPGLPLWTGIAIAFAARNTAVYFTKWYPSYHRTKFATSAASAS